MLSNLILLHRGLFLALDFPTSLSGLVFLKVNLTSKDRGKEDTEYLGLFQVLCHHVPCPPQQQAHIFPSLPSAHDVPVEAFIANLHITHQIQLQTGFVSAISIPACLGTASSYSSWSPVPVSSACIHPFHV